MYQFMGLPFASDYIYSFLLMLVLAALVCMTQRKWLQVVILSPFWALQLFFCVANILCYTSLAEVFSLESFLSIVNAVVASKSGNYHFGFIFPVVLIAAVYVVGVIIVMVKCQTPVVKRRLWQPIICIALVIVSLFTNLVYYGTLPEYYENYVQNLDNKKFIYDTFSNRIQNMKMFGTYSFYLNNLLYVLSLKNSADEALGIDVQTELINPDTYGYESLAEQQLGDGNNLIMILMETFEKSAINPVTMPNLYNFMNQSCTQIDGYYSIERTCFTDYISQTGIHALGKEMWSSYGDVEIPFSLANIFNRSGYVTNAFHDYNFAFYRRDKVFPKALGFQNWYDFYRYDSERRDDLFNANKDETLFKKNLDRIAPADKKFYSYLISISTHGLAPIYDLRDEYPEEFAYIEQPENLERLKQWYPWLSSNDKDQVKTIKNYLAGTMSFDKGFAALLKYLRETKNQDGNYLIDTTAIVMFGDHYYYMSPSAVNPERDDNLIGNKCPFIVYNPKAPEAQGNKDNPLGRTIERFTATMDIYKTVCSLFGVVTDKQLTYGHSVLIDDAIYPENRTVGIGYMNGYTWGKDWRTSDFIEFAGRDLSADEIADWGAIANRAYSAIVANMSLYAKDGFKDLEKCKYSLGSFVSTSKTM